MHGSLRSEHDVRCKDHITKRQKLPYLTWHSRAAESHKKHETQTVCSQCFLFFWGWELKPQQKSKK